MILIAYINGNGERIERIFVGKLDNIFASMAINRCQVRMIQHL